MVVDGSGLVKGLDAHDYVYLRDQHMNISTYTHPEYRPARMLLDLAQQLLTSR